MSHNIIIKGCGPTGALSAISLAKIGYDVEIYELQSRTDLFSRSRAYAITHSSRCLLEDNNLWYKISPYCSSFNQLIVEDRYIKNLFIFKLSDLFPLNRSYDAVGWILDHRDLMEVLLEEIDNTPNIKIFFEASTTNLLHCDLIVAADGFSSLSRDQAGINTLSFKYNQACVTSKVLIRGVSTNTAYEILRKEGPMAILPLGEGEFQIVITDSIHKSYEKINLPKYLFLDYLATILPNGMEPDCLIDKPSVFPIAFSISLSVFKNKIVLVGETAHSFHPVGGQGLNLCWRDVSRLKHLLSANYLSNKNLRYISIYYNRDRYIDILFTGLITDFIVRFFSGYNLFTFPIRKILFMIISRFRLVRMYILKIMTDGI